MVQILNMMSSDSWLELSAHAQCDADHNVLHRAVDCVWASDRLPKGREQVHQFVPTPGHVQCRHELADDAVLLETWTDRDYQSVPRAHALFAAALTCDCVALVHVEKISDGILVHAKLRDVKASYAQALVQDLTNERTELFQNVDNECVRHLNIGGDVLEVLNINIGKAPFHPLYACWWSLFARLLLLLVLRIRIMSPIPSSAWQPRHASRL